jgi:hypothetical protein
MSNQVEAHSTPNRTTRDTIEEKILALQAKKHRLAGNLSSLVVNDIVTPASPSATSFDPSWG